MAEDTITATLEDLRAPLAECKTAPQTTLSPKEHAAALARLQEPFEIDEIELLPRYTGKKEQVGDKWVVPKSAMQDCRECGGYHGFPCVHLSYVGHAGITMRLNAVDPDWDWRPVAVNDDGTPKMLQIGRNYGMWIWMTVLGKTILAFGDAGDKSNLSGSAVKEIIGDAIRNGAMRRGVGTYLWSKSEAAKAILTRQGADDDDDLTEEEAKKAAAAKAAAEPKKATDAERAAFAAMLETAKTNGHRDKLLAWMKERGLLAKNGALKTTSVDLFYRLPEVLRDEGTAIAEAPPADEPPSEEPATEEPQAEEAPAEPYVGPTAEQSANFGKLLKAARDNGQRDTLMEWFGKHDLLKDGSIVDGTILRFLALPLDKQAAAIKLAKTKAPESAG